MPLPFTQDNRFLSLMLAGSSQDKLLVNGFSARERISTLFHVDVDVLLNGVATSKELLGQQATLAVAMSADGEKRYFNGIINEVEFGTEVSAVVSGAAGRFRRARVKIVPKLWLTTLRSGFKIYESMDVAELLTQVLGEYGITASYKLFGTLPRYDFCYKYRETDFNFLSRIMEREGIYYYFRHELNEHKLVVANRKDAHRVSPMQASAVLAAEKGYSDADHFFDWEMSQSVASAGYQLYDWHFGRAPQEFGTSIIKSKMMVPQTDKLTIVDYPPRTSDTYNKEVSETGSLLEQHAKLRMEEIESENPLYYGTSNCRGLTAGEKFTLQGATSDEYVLTSINHTGAQMPPYISGTESSTPYSNSVTCIPAASQFRPPYSAEIPVVAGPQTALVTDGPDKFGRFRLRFHWAAEAGESSGWARVAQSWAGPRWGAIFLPRIGHEVLVDFVDGSPDHPIIVGSLYNQQNQVPYSLPENYTRSGIKTRSMSPTGGSQGGSEEFNELRFEDRMGEEDIYFHAQRDFHRVVEHDDDLKVKHDRTELIENKSETEAYRSIEFKVGPNSILLDQSGITIKGTMIKVEATATLDTKAGAMAKHEATGTMIIKGAMVMIN